jgi:hypothetical protein
MRLKPIPAQLLKPLLNPKLPPSAPKTLLRLIQPQRLLKRYILGTGTHIGDDYRFVTLGDGVSLVEGGTSVPVTEVGE